jgi:hypothetical protein
LCQNISYLANSRVSLDIYCASPSSAPSAHPYVNYTSHPYSKDVDNSIGAYSQADHHSEASDGIANLEPRITGLEREVKDFKTEIFPKIDVLGMKFEKQLASFANNQQEQFTDLYYCGLFGVSLPLHIISVSNAIRWHASRGY